MGMGGSQSRVVTRMRSARHADSLRYVCMYGSTWEVV